MKIHLLSDVHLEFDPYTPYTKDYDVVILAGDIGLGTQGAEWAINNFKCPILYVTGNHEFYGSTYSHVVQNLKLIKASNFFFLDNEAVTLDGVTFYGGTCWTDFNLFNTAPLEVYAYKQKLNDSRKIRVNSNGVYRSLNGYDVLEFHRNFISGLEECDPAPKVVISHHAPAEESLAYIDSYSPFYASNLNLKGALWVHGHTHNCVDYEKNGVRVVSNPRGYHGYEKTGFNPKLVLTV